MTALPSAKNLLCRQYVIALSRFLSLFISIRAGHYPTAFTTNIPPETVSSNINSTLSVLFIRYQLSHQGM